MNTIAIRNNKATASYLAEQPYRIVSVLSGSEFIGILIYTNHISTRKVHSGEKFSFFPVDSNIQMAETNENEGIHLGRLGGADIKCAFHKYIKMPNGIEYKSNLKNIRFGYPGRITDIEIAYCLSLVQWDGRQVYSNIEEIFAFLNLEVATRVQVTNGYVNRVDFLWNEDFIATLAETRWMNGKDLQTVISAIDPAVMAMPETETEEVNLPKPTIRRPRKPGIRK